MSPRTTDVTPVETKHPDAERRASFLEAVVDAIQEGVVVTDDKRILEVNDALCTMLGFTRDELVGAKLPFPFFPPEEVERLHSLLRGLRAVGTAEWELTLMRKDGLRFPALLTTGTAQLEGYRVGRVITIRDISERRRREARLTELAATDELTGLPNRRSFLATLAGEVARAKRHERPLSLAILDLDGFKEVNDLGGHQNGDRVLAEAGARLGALVRSGEHMARVGGDEFGWILPDADSEGAVAAVDRARLAIALDPFEGTAARLTISAGICTSDGSIHVGEFYRRADSALYVAKTAGGDSAHAF